MYGWCVGLVGSWYVGGMGVVWVEEFECEEM